MPAIKISRGTDTDRGIAALVHEITAGPSMSEISSWVIERHVNVPDRLTVTFRVDAERLDEALRGVPDPKTPTVLVPVYKGPVRDEQPISHAPTACQFIVAREATEGGETARVCGELIQWVPAIPEGAWVHTGDRYLGACEHPATPGPVAPPLPRLPEHQHNDRCLDAGGSCSPEGQGYWDRDRAE